MLLQLGRGAVRSAAVAAVAATASTATQRGQTQATPATTGLARTSALVLEKTEPTVDVLGAAARIVHAPARQRHTDHQNTDGHHDHRRDHRHEEVQVEPLGYQVCECDLVTVVSVAVGAVGGGSQGTCCVVSVLLLLPLLPLLPVVLMTTPPPGQSVRKIHTRKHTTSHTIVGHRFRGLGGLGSKVGSTNTIE